MAVAIPCTATGGTQGVSPTATTTYTATATGTGGKARLPRLLPSPLAAGAHRHHHRQPHFDCFGQLVHLNGDSGQRHRGDGERNGWQHLYACRRTGGTQSVSPTATTTYTATATGTGGKTTPARDRDRWRRRRPSASQPTPLRLRGQIVHVDRDCDQRHGR